MRTYTDIESEKDAVSDNNDNYVPWSTYPWWAAHECSHLEMNYSKYWHLVKHIYCPDTTLLVYMALNNAQCFVSMWLVCCWTVGENYQEEIHTDNSAFNLATIYPEKCNNCANSTMNCANSTMNLLWVCVTHVLRVITSNIIIWICMLPLFKQW